MSESSSGGWSDADEAPGTHIALPKLPSAHRYRIDGPLGQGGMGEVFRAWDAVLHRFVALKCVHPRQDSPLLRVRLLREARLTARLEHPGILPILDAGELPDGRLFYTMRMVTGMTLAEAAPTLTEAERLRHVVEAVRAVAYAHAQQTLHRDLKPSNIMVGALGETYVVDWGLARSINDEEEDLSGVSVASGSERLTTAGAIVGTQRYLSPDGLRGESTLSSDVFALGASLIEVLTGGRVEQSSEWTERAQMLGNPVLSAIARRAVDPVNRYPTARELLADLTSYVENQPVGAYNYSTLEYLGQLVRRHRWPVALAATALVVGSVVATIGTVRVMHERDRAVEAESHARAAQHRADSELAESLVRQASSAVQDVRFADAELAAARALALSPDPQATGVLMASMALTPRFVDTTNVCEGRWVTGVEGRACVPDETDPFEPAAGGGYWQLGASSARHVGVDGTSRSQDQLFGYRHDVQDDTLLRSNRHALNLWLGSTVVAAEPCDGHMIDTARLAPDGVWGACDDDRLFHMDWSGHERYLPMVGTDQYHRSAAVHGDRFFAIRDSVIDELDLTTGERLRIIEPRAGLLRGVEASDDWLFIEGADMPATLVRRTEASRPVLRTSIAWEQAAMTRAGNVVTTSGPDWTLALDDGLMSAAHFEEGIASIMANTAGNAVVVARGGARFAVVDLPTMAVRWNTQLPSEQVGKSAAFDPTDTTVLASAAGFDAVMQLDAFTGELLQEEATILSGCRRLVSLTSGWWCTGTGRRWLYSEPGGVRDSDELWVDLSASGVGVAVALTESGRMARLQDGVEWLDGRAAQGRIGVDATGDVMAWDTETQLWALHPRTGTHSLSPRPERILDVAVSPDGQWVAASGMDSVDVWRTDTGEHVASLPALHEERVASLVFTQDLLVTSGWDGQVRKWSLAPLTAPPTPEDVRRRWRLPL